MVWDDDFGEGEGGGLDHFVRGGGWPGLDHVVRGGGGGLNLDHLVRGIPGGGGGFLLGEGGGGSRGARGPGEGDGTTVKCGLNMCHGCRGSRPGCEADRRAGGGENLVRGG